MSTARAGTIALFLAFSASCGQTPPPPEGRAALGGEVVARVGASSIPRSLVAAVAGAKDSSPRAALDLVVEDALFAEHARSSGAASRIDVRWAIRAALARATLRRIREAAAPDSPPSDVEVGRLTALHAAEVDHPPLRQVVHAVVRRKEKPPLDEEGGKHLAEVLLAATAPVSAEAFEATAKAVPAGGWSVVVESLPPFMESGKTMIGADFDPAFAKGAFEIPAEGDTRVVVSSFGWHVVRLLNKLPGVAYPLEHRRALFAGEAFRDRGKATLDADLAALRTATPPVVDPASGATMSWLIEIQR